MEEAKAVETMATEKPPNPQTITPNLPPRPKKRSLDTLNNLHNSHYFKIRLILKELRPHFIQVLKAPDFRNCKAAHEIQEKTKVMMGVYKEMTAETAFIGKCKNVAESQTPSTEKRQGEKPQDVKPGEAPQQDRGFGKASNLTAANNSADGQNQGSYVVGGSAFGWNFITFTSNRPVYYGRSKESFRAAAAAAEKPSS